MCAQYLAWLPGFRPSPGHGQGGHRPYAALFPGRQIWRGREEGLHGTYSVPSPKFTNEINPLTPKSGMNEDVQRNWQRLFCRFPSWKEIAKFFSAVEACVKWNHGPPSHSTVGTMMISILQTRKQRLWNQSLGAHEKKKSEKIETWIPGHPDPSICALNISCNASVCY